MKLTVAVLGIALGLPVAGWSDDAIHQTNNDAYTNAPGVPASTTTVHTGVSKTRRRKHKASSTETHLSTATTSAAPPIVAPPGNSVIDGIGNGMGPNRPGNPNMGTSDHVPGTTGTSGQ